MKHVLYRLIVICSIAGNMIAPPMRSAIVMAEDTPSRPDIATPSPTPTANADPSDTSTPVSSVSVSTTNTLVQPTADSLGPVIFVPGIMGSYLDVAGCNVWPGIGQLEFTWLGTVKCPLFPNKSVLNLDTSDTNVKATDAYRCTSLYASVSNYTTCSWDFKTSQYSKLLNRLTEAGYREYLSSARDANGNRKNAIERCEEARDNNIPLAESTLYVLGYDWRQETEDSADTLQSLVDCVYSRHSKKINLVGHSMGGLVIKQYLLKSEDNAARINSVSTFNTPYLGAVRAIDILGTGVYQGVTKLMAETRIPNYLCSGSLLALCITEIVYVNTVMSACDKSNYPLQNERCADWRTKLSTLARSFPGAIQLLPSNLYLDQMPGTLVWNGNPITNKTEHWNKLADEFGVKAKLYQLAEPVGRDDTGDIVTRTANIHYLIQFSSNTKSTITTAKKSQSGWSFELGAGDGTVNELSLTRMNERINYNPKSNPNRKVYIFGFCDKKIDHTGIVNDPTALNTLVTFLTTPLSLGQQNTCVNGKSIPLTGYEDTPITLTSPTHEFISTNGGWPNFTWQDGSNPPSTKKGYRIQISKNSDMSNPIIDVCTKNQNYQQTNLWSAQADVGTYHWRVNYMTVDWKNDNECKSFGVSNSWSDTRSFTNPDVDKRPQLTSPNNMYLSPSGVWPTFTWSPVPNVPTTYGYRIQIFKLISFEETMLVVDECRMSPTYTALDPNWTKKFAGLYKWQVTYATQPWDTKNPSSCAKNSIEPRLWSDSRLFINDNEPLRIAAVAPADGITTTDGGWPLLQWNNGNFQTNFGYRLQISTNADFSNLIVDECTMDRSYKPIDNWWAQIQTGQFYWRVNYMQKPWFSGKVTQAQKTACKNVSGAIDSSYWSISRSFTNPVIPKSPQVISPADGFQSANGYWADLTWVPVNNMPAFFGYRIQVSRDRFFLDAKQLIVDECRMQPTYVANSPEWTKLHTGVFYWRVNYVQATWNTIDPSSCKNTPVTTALWSSVRSFSNANPADRIAAEDELLGVYSDGTVGGWISSWDGYSEIDLPVSLTQVIAVANGGHSLALKSNGTVVAWGCDNEDTNYNQCQIPSGLNNVKAIAAGGLHSLALKHDGTVVAWGYNAFGQTKVPSSLTNVIAIAAGIHHSLALKADGTVVCWGNCGKMPAKLSGVVAIAGGYKFSLALKSDRTVVMWGKFDADIARPLPSNLSGVIAIAAFNDHAMFLKADGTVVGAGFALGGELDTPAGLNNVVAIKAGLYHSYALKSNGQIVGWGDCAWDDSGACISTAPGNGVMLNK